MSDYLELAEKAVDRALKLGLDEAEAFVSVADVKRVVGEASRLSSVENRTSARFVVRGVLGKKVGAATTDIVDERAVRDVVERAVRSARAAPEDPRWPGFPATKPRSSDTHFDRGLLLLRPEELVELTAEVLELVRSEEPAAEVPDVGAQVAVSRIAVANSSGAAGQYTAAGAWLFFTLVARPGGKVTPTIFESEVRKDSRFDVTSLVSSGVEALRDAQRFVAAETCERPAVLTPHALYDLLSYTLFPAVSGDNIVRGKSPLARKLGEEVVSSSLTVVDDPTDPANAGERPFDDEGVPSRKTVVMDEGTFSSALWNTYWGAAAGVESTGNGSRNLATGEVTVSPTTLVVKPGSRSATAMDLASEFGECYLIRGFQGAHTANPDTGDFSVVATPAYLVRSGEVVGTVEGLMMSGNAFELLSSVEKVGSDVKNLGSLVTPSIAFSMARFAAKS